MNGNPIIINLPPVPQLKDYVVGEHPALWVSDGMRAYEKAVTAWKEVAAAITSQLASVQKQ